MPHALVIACHSILIFDKMYVLCVDKIYVYSNILVATMQVYQEKGLRDKERYKTEMLEYKSSYDSTPH